ncbi:MAG TPA: hypothetical protein VMM92_08500 [Thermoanaerobaculia bacterium]|nr:hypothetical protein [Thermoanaerobaculia bacterium]
MTDPLISTSVPPGPPAATPTIRISDWLSNGWQVLQPFWVQAVLTLWVMFLARLLGTLLCLLPGLVIAGPLIAGVQIHLAKRLLGLPASLDDLFLGFRRFADTFLIGLVLYLVPVLISFGAAAPRLIASLVTGGEASHDAGLFAVTTLLSAAASLVSLAYLVFANTALIFALPLVVFRQMKAVDAMRQSFELVKPQILGFLFLFVILYLVGMAGFFAGLIVCIGWLVTAPLAAALIYLVQLQAFREFVGLSESDLAPYRN